MLGCQRLVLGIMRGRVAGVLWQVGLLGRLDALDCGDVSDQD